MVDAKAVQEPSRDGQLYTDTPLRPTSSNDLLKLQEHGVTILWEPEEGSEVLADVIFVHGLGGHPRTTWQYGKAVKSVTEETAGAAQKKSRWNIFKMEKSSKSAKNKTRITPEPSGPLEAPKNESQSPNCFWPYDLVPYDFGNVRLLTYGYDSHPSHFYTGRTVQMNISQHSQQLLQSITDYRRECRGRPIIFVVHSLGGILVKDAIILSGKYEYQPAMKDVSLSCTAIFFFGTPHQGANAAAYGDMLANLVGALPLFPSVYREVLRGLRPDGEKLSNVTADFNDLLNKEMPAANKIQLYSFREGKPLTNLKKFDGKVVPDTSAFFNRRDIEQTSMIMANHLDMCKFDNAQNPGYVSFRAALSDYLSCLQAQVTASPREEQERSIAKLITETDLTQALDFGARIRRQQQLAKLLTSKATFEWVWSSEFAGWLVNKEPLFWISGRPASGKSTLMYHLAKSDRTQKLLEHSFGKQTTYIYHFFDFRAAGGLGNNFVGFVRSLLLQLISRFPHLSDRALRLGARREEHQGRSLGAGEFELAELSEVLLETLHAVPGHVFIALDGLDEYADEPMELVSFIKSMAQLNTKVCLASRPDAPFPDAFATMPSLKMHELNAPGIFTFARQAFGDAAIQRHWANQDQSHVLAEEIVSQSQGVFLWARFATLEIIDGLSKGDLSPSDDLVAAVHQLPTDLEELYSRIICRASPEDRALARVTLVYVAYALHTPKLIMLQSLLQLHTGDPSPWFREITYVDRWPEDIEPFRRKILASTGGLIEMYADSNVRQAEGKLANMGLLHRTVKTYLGKKGWTELSQSLSDPGCEQSLWLQSCALFMHHHDDFLRRSKPIGHSSAAQFWYPSGPLRLSEEDTDSSESALDPRNRGRRAALSCPSVGVRLLMAYALTYMPAHAQNFEERAKLSSYSILKNILSPSFCAAHPFLSDGTCVCVQTRNCEIFDNIPMDLRLIVGHSLNGYIQECILAEGNQPMQAAQPLPSLPVNAPVRSWLTASAHAISRLGKQPVQKKEAIRRYAVQFAICDPNPLRVSTLRIALLHSPTVTDDELLAAIAWANFGAIECMMSLRSPNKLLLRSKKSRRPKMPLYNMLIRHEDHFLGIFSGDIEMRPFWAVGRRDIADTEAVIDLLISRAENINEQCGPFGTVLHSYFDSVAGSTPYENHMFNLLVAKGADVNATGPYGTVLEFVWMLANTYKTSKLRYVIPFRSMIHELIEVGAVNNREDPNGLVPSIERMKNFAMTADAYAEAKRFYKHGPRQSGVPAARWTYANLWDQIDVERQLHDSA